MIPDVPGASETESVRHPCRPSGCCGGGRGRRDARGIAPPHARTSFSCEDPWTNGPAWTLAPHDVVRDGERLVAYGAVRDRGEMSRGRDRASCCAWPRDREAPPRPRWSGVWLDTVDAGSRDGVDEAEMSACRLLESMRYWAVRCSRDAHRIDRTAAAADLAHGALRRGVRPEHDARAFYEPSRSVADHRSTLCAISRHGRGITCEREVDPTLWCVVKAADEARPEHLHRQDVRGRLVQILSNMTPWRGRRHRPGARRRRLGRPGTVANGSVGLGVDAESVSGASASTSAPV